MLLQTLLAFGVGLLIMLASSQVFLNITRRVAAKWKFSPLFISIVLVALGTNLPELTLTLSALVQNDPGFAMGNLVGSSILNITLVLGIATLFSAVRIGTKKTQYNAAILLAVTLLFIGVQFSSLQSFIGAAILLIALMFSLIYQYLAAVSGRFNEDEKIIRLIKRLQNKKAPLPSYIYVLGFIASVIGLGIGGYVTVETVSQLSLILGLSTTVLGLTLTAIATSMPELILTVLASRKHENKVVIGTLIGSNIFNLTLFPALILISSQPIAMAPTEFVFLLLATLATSLTILYYKGTTIPKKVSFGFLLIFLGFIYTTFAAINGFLL